MKREVNIALLADLHVRFGGTRHDEYKIVFDRTLKDLREQEPERIIIAGDLVHNKINLSPNQITLLAEFIVGLSKIAPTDIICGNHDVNLSHLGQGDAIEVIFKMAEQLEHNEQLFMINEQNKEETDYWKKAAYYYPDSGFYDIGKDIILGVFSCKDNKMIKIENKDNDKYYIAIWHGMLYGARMDNGFEMKDEGLVKPSSFDGFDLVCMGDIHEFQTFEREHTMDVSEAELQEYLEEGWEVVEQKEFA